MFVSLHCLHDCIMLLHDDLLFISNILTKASFKYKDKLFKIHHKRNRDIYA